MFDSMITFIARSMNQKSMRPISIGCIVLVVLYTVGLYNLAAMPLHDIHNVSGEQQGDHIIFSTPHYWPASGQTQLSGVKITPHCLELAHHIGSKADFRTTPLISSDQNHRNRIKLPPSFLCPAPSTIVVSLERTGSLFGLLRSNY